MEVDRVPSPKHTLRNTLSNKAKEDESGWKNLKDRNDTVIYKMQNINTVIAGEKTHWKSSDQQFHQKLIGSPSHSNVTLKLKTRGEHFEVFMDLISSQVFVPNALVSIINDGFTKKKKDFKIAAMKELKVYEGSVNKDKGSYACGCIEEDAFRGFVMLGNGTVMYVDPTRKLSATLSEDRDQFIVSEKTFGHIQNCSDSKHPNKSCQVSSILHSHFCEREGKHNVICFYGQKKSKFTAFPRSSVQNISLQRNKNHLHFQSSTCSVRLTSDVSHYMEAHNKSVTGVLRELLVVFLHANHILRHADLNGDGKPDHLRLRISGVTIYASHSGLDSSDGSGSVRRRLDKLRMEPQDECISLIFLRERLPSEPVSIARGGGVCQSNKNQAVSAQNVAIINTMDSSNSLLTTCWATTKAIGQVMGSMEKDCESDTKYTPENDWMRFFSECRLSNIAHTLASQGFCLKKSGGIMYLQKNLNLLEEKVCGNGIVEPPEQCDCGSVLDCAMKKHCCVPPGQLKECTLDSTKGYECDMNDRCCGSNCKFIPESLNLFCGKGEPNCTSLNAYCNGNSSRCPMFDDISSPFDGRSCGVDGTGTCVGGRCNNTVCYKLGILECKCDASSGNECRVCCKKESMGSPCLPAEEFGQKLKTPGFLYRHHGTVCGSTNEGHCDEIGVCSSKMLNSADPIFHHKTGTSASNLLEFLFILFKIFCRYVIFWIIF